MVSFKSAILDLHGISIIFAMPQSYDHKIFFVIHWLQSLLDISSPGCTVAVVLVVGLEQLHFWVVEVGLGQQMKLFRVDGRESKTCFASLVHLCPAYHPQSYQLICQEIIRRKAPKSQSGHISRLKVLTPCLVTNISF